MVNMMVLKSGSGFKLEVLGVGSNVGCPSWLTTTTISLFTSHTHTTSASWTAVQSESTHR